MTVSKLQECYQQYLMQEVIMQECYQQYLMIGASCRGLGVPVDAQHREQTFHLYCCSFCMLNLYFLHT